MKRTIPIRPPFQTLGSKARYIFVTITLHSYLSRCTVYPYWAIPIKCFVSHRPPSREGGSVGRAKKKKNEHMIAY